jgi:pilus assembly protein CpaB
MRSIRVGAARFGALGFLAIALGCAALAALAFGKVVQSRYAGARVVAIVVAKSALRAGEPLRAESLATRDWPADAVPSGAYGTVEEILAGNPTATPVVGILAGEPVVAGRLSSTAAGAGIASLVRKGLRGIALRIDDAAGETGLVYPGAIVDVVTTVRDPQGRGPSARIAVQSARVLSVGRDTDVATHHREPIDDSQDRGRVRATFVTLEVTPDQAEILAVARNEGRIDLVLRNAVDEDAVDTRGATPDRFSAFAPANPAGRAVPPGDRGDRKRGGKRVHITAPDRAGIEVFHAR